jgi:hypothetical protein
MFTKGFVVCAASLVLSVVMADAAQQGTAAKKLLVKSTPSGTHKLLYRAQNNTGTVVGDPTASGATFNLQLTPGGTQCLPLPAGGWTAIGSQGFKYADPSLANGPVKVAQIKASPSGAFKIKIIAKGSGITVVPGNPTGSYATNFRISDGVGGGEEYCGSTGSAVPSPNNEITFNVVNDDGTTCSLGPC